MKVLLINSVCGTGSTGRIVADLHDVIIKSGGDSKIAFGIGNVNRVDATDTFYFGSKFDYYIHNILSKITDRAGFYSKKNTRKLIKFIKEYNPDIIHLHNLHGYYLNVKILFEYLRTCNKPIVWTLHDCWAFTGHCAHFTQNGCYKWKERCHSCSETKNRYPRSYVMNRCERNYIEKKFLFTEIENMHIMTPSQWLAAVTRQSFMKKYDISAVGNGIDLDEFKPKTSDFRSRYGLKDKIIILGVASAWIEQKGIRDYIELSKILNRKYKIVLIGMTDEQIKAMPGEILALPRTSTTEELVKIYSSADIYVNFSVEETFGMTTVEALACGIPVITYDKSSVPEPVCPDNGFVVKTGDLNEVKHIIENFPHFDKDKIRSTVLKYDKKTIYRNLIKIYKEILEMR